MGLKDLFPTKIFSSRVSRLCLCLLFVKQTEKKGYFYADVEKAHPL